MCFRIRKFQKYLLSKLLGMKSHSKRAKILSKKSDKFALFNHGGKFSLLE